MKICSKCNIEKPLTDFYNKKESKDGKVTKCKICNNLNKKEYYKLNKEDILLRVKKYQSINNKDIKIKQQNYYQANKTQLKTKNKEYTKNNASSINEYIKNYREINKIKIKEQDKIYRKNNRKKLNIKSRIFKKERLKTDNLFKLRVRISGNIRGSFKRAKHIKNSKTQDILGCSFIEFKQHIESKFESWMTWDNYGNPKDGILELDKTWDLDHIMPISLAITEEDIILLNHYTNFQPLCSYYNRNIKGDNY